MINLFLAITDEMDIASVYKMNEQVLTEMWSNSTHNALVYISCVFAIYVVAMVLTILQETYKVTYTLIISSRRVGAGHTQWPLLRALFSLYIFSWLFTFLPEMVDQGFLNFACILCHGGFNIMFFDIQYPSAIKTFKSRSFEGNED